MSLNVLDAMAKRKRWPVNLGEDTVYIRAMLKSEQRESQEVKVDPAALKAMPEEDRVKAEADMNELRGYFIFGTILVQPDGSPAFSREPGESAIDFATRVDAAMANVPEDNKLLILQALTKAHTVPSVEKLAKN